LRGFRKKDIGVTIDSELTFESHICEKVNKATSIFGALRRAFRYLDKKLFIPLQNNGENTTRLGQLSLGTI
jgi:hypothetical protein